MNVLIEPDCGSCRKQAVELWRGYKMMKSRAIWQFENDNIQIVE